MKNVLYFTDLPELNKYIQGSDLNDTLLIASSQSSKNKLEKLYKSTFDFINVSFSTETDFRKMLIVPEFTQLEDIKRYLCLFFSIPEDLKRKYDLTDYFASVSYLNNVLEFFKEINEALLLPDMIIPLLAKDLNLKHWQEDYLKDLILIYESYKDYLQQVGYSDKIFTDYHNDLNFQEIKLYKNLIVINKLEFSELDKYIFKKLTDLGLEIKIFIQGTEKEFESDTLALKSADLYDIEIDKLSLYESKNKFGMHRQFLNLLNNQKIDEIIDHDLANENFYASLNREYFQIKDQKDFNNTRIYRFLNQLNDLLTDLVFEDSRKKTLMSLYRIYHAMMNQEFAGVLNLNLSTEVLYRLRMLFQELNQHAFFYIDVEGEFLNQYRDIFQKYEMEDFFEKFLLFIRNFLSFNKLESLLDYLSNFSLNNFAVLFNQNDSDELDVYLEALVNIKSIFNLQLLKEFNTLFPHSNYPASNLLGFVLEFLRAKRLSMKTEDKKATDRIRITDFNNASDVDAEHIVILNLQEGILPAVRKIPFILNEKQREILHLQTFSQKQLIEKYKFRNLLLNCQTAHLFYILNQDENTQRSSYLEEIILNHKIVPEKLEDIAYGNYYTSIIQSLSTNLPNQKIKNNPKFYIIPFNAQEDLVEGELKLSYYSWSKMKADAFCWLIDSQYKFSCFEELKKPYLSLLNLGNFGHKIIERLIDHQDFLNLDNSSLFISKIERYFNQLQTDPKGYYYKLPYNFDGKFFNLILKDTMKQRIFEFMSKTRSHLITEYPNWEAESILKKEKPVIFNGDSLNLILNGRVDLLINDNEDYYLFDFKTGQSSKAQLLFYRMIWQFINEDHNWSSFSAKTYNLISGKEEILPNLDNNEDSMLTVIKLYEEILIRISGILSNNCTPSDKMKADDFYIPVVRLKELRNLLSEKG